jgi:dolichyl-diphosphooligosaccharide--protein glycosyltransferase
MSDGIANVMTQNNPAWTKLFERVPGATIEGTGPANTTIEASVEMVNHETGESFTYTQRTRTGPDGNFEMTVPYSTTGYDEYGPENGYTNVSVRATGPYEFTVPLGNAGIPLDGTAQVTEGQVIGENETASTVDLQVARAQQPAGETNSTSADGS